MGGCDVGRHGVYSFFCVRWDDDACVQAECAQPAGVVPLGERGAYARVWAHCGLCGRRVCDVRCAGCQGDPVPEDARWWADEGACLCAGQQPDRPCGRRGEARVLDRDHQEGRGRARVRVQPGQPLADHDPGRGPCVGRGVCRHEKALVSCPGAHVEPRDRVRTPTFPTTPERAAPTALARPRSLWMILRLLLRSLRLLALLSRASTASTGLSFSPTLMVTLSSSSSAPSKP